MVHPAGMVAERDWPAATAGTEADKGVLGATLVGLCEAKAATDYLIGASGDALQNARCWRLCYQDVAMRSNLSYPVSGVPAE